MNQQKRKQTRASAGNSVEEKSGEKGFITRRSRRKSENLLRKIGVKEGGKGGIWMLMVKLNLHKNHEVRGENGEKVGRKWCFCDQT